MSIRPSITVVTAAAAAVLWIAGGAVPAGALRHENLNGDDDEEQPHGGDFERQRGSSRPSH